MIVEINWPMHKVYVNKEGKDPRVYSESRFFHQVRVTLQSYGYNVIKKLMWKDGHMVSDSQYYIRERKGKWAIWYPEYALRFVYEDYNKEGKVTLRLEE